MWGEIKIVTGARNDRQLIPVIVVFSLHQILAGAERNTLR
jgi:hypothetical protein